MQKQFRSHIFFTVDKMATSAEITPTDSPVKKVNEGNSWQFSKSVVECNRHMLDSGLAADVTFLVSGSNGVYLRNAYFKIVIVRCEP